MKIPKYDKKEYVFPGLFGDVVKLPSGKKSKKSNIYYLSADTIKLEEDEKKMDIYNIHRIGAICQHFVSLDRIMYLRKKNPNKFINILHKFMNQFVIESKDQFFVCKSCGTQLDIKKFVMQKPTLFIILQLCNARY